MGNSKQQIKDIDLEFDFDMMMELAKNSPEEFEALRLELIEDYITSLPQERQHRMKCLQWRIDRTREQAKTPLGSCMAITEMMWESFEQLNTLFMEMKNSDNKVKVNVQLQMAKILPFQAV
ncbi:MAG: DUF3135 domain-containing protein [Gammaproteobacteria bacterium]